MKVSVSNSDSLSATSYSYVLTNSTMGPVITPLQEVKLPVISTNIFTPYYYNMPLPRHLDLNFDKSVRDQMAKYYFYRTIDDWLLEPNKLGYLLSYLKVSGDKAEVVKDLKHFDVDAYMKDTQRNAEIKVEYIEDHVLSQHSVHKVLKEYIMKENANWYDLQKSVHKDHVMSAIGKYLQNKLRRMIKGEKEMSDSDSEL
jgi:hypothetical protein